MPVDTGKVIDAAAKLADQQGLERVTLQRIARALRIKPPSLYNHVDGLDEIKQRLADRGAHELYAKLAAALVGRAGAPGIQALAAAYRAFAREHPGLYDAAQRARGADADATVELVSRILPGDVHAIRALRSALHGFVVLERQGGFGLPDSIDESFTRLVDLLVKALTPRRQP